ncbi:MAG: hypothetical protein ACTSWP_09015 [Candidatus Freyarchaeota archaeon]|nr:hypothetical protein [Candidatus Freyrarchaeum guaymaensis]
MADAGRMIAEAVSEAVRREPLAIPVMVRLIVRYGMEYLKDIGVKEQVEGLDGFEDACLKWTRLSPLRLPITSIRGLQG